MNNKTNNNNDTSKNIIVLFMTIIIVAVVILFCSLSSRINELEKRINKLETPPIEQNFNTGIDYSLFDIITMSDIKNESKGKTIVVWLGLETCGYCQAYAPLLAETASEYNIKAKYVDTAAMTDEDFNILISLEGVKGWENYGSSFTGTPFTMIIKDNKIIGGLNGYHDSANIAQALELAGLKK